ncbi:MAG: hypothetical protein MJK18_08170, partial [Bdellovibrionales bacterium]|nr:hypothetical protein [Bdellovibrionales bacterium]
ETKEKMLRRVVNGSKKESLGQLRAIMGGMFPSNQKDLHRQFSDRYYELLKAVIKKEDRYMMSAFSRSLVPTLCDQQSSKQLKDFMEAEKMPFSVLKSLKRAHEENDRCIGIRALIKDTSKKTTL